VALVVIGASSLPPVSCPIQQNRYPFRVWLHYATPLRSALQTTLIGGLPAARAIARAIS